MNARKILRSVFPPAVPLLPVLVCVAVVAAFLAGRPPKAVSVPLRGVEFSGVVTEVKLRNYGQSLTVRTDSADIRVAATLPEFRPVVEVGDSVIISGTWSDPRIETDLPMERDLSEYYRSHGVSLVCYCAADSFRITGRSNNILYTLRRLQPRLAAEIHTLGLEPATAQFLTAILTGDDSDIGGERRDDYAEAGVAHVLALSGAHVAIIATILAIFLFPLAALGYGRTRWIVTLVALWVFAAMTGMSASVVRSVTMASAVIVAIMADRRRYSLNALCMAAILILAVDPQSLFRPGFQLSFLATAAIILFSDRLNPFGSSRRNLLRVIGGTLGVTLAATLATMPFVAYHFHRLPVYFLISNFAAAAVMPVMIGGGVTLLILHVLGFHAGWLVWLLDRVCGLFDATVAWCSALPMASVADIYFEAWLLIPVTVAMATIVIAFARKKVLWTVIALLAVASTVAIGIMFAPVYPDGETYIARSKQFTALIHHDADTLAIHVIDRGIVFDADSTELVDRYTDFIGSRKIKQIKFTVSDRCDENFTIGDRQFTIANGQNPLSTGRDTLPADQRSVYCIVTKGFRGKIVDLARRSGSDTILLAADLNPIRRRRYLSELQADSIPAVDLSAATFILTKPLAGGIRAED